MATPTQAPTKVPQEPDPFYYDYDTVQTVGMTLAAILFLLGILLIISKKVKCRKADSRSESIISSSAIHMAIGFLDAFLSGLCFHSPTCKSSPGGGGV
ncbi:FXYD domain-containing ion transport regulator 7 isoform X2 [Ailuropoda melanoleuca]|uniref:FXYD domain-containing ion transport regulator 7 isoform X2 n=1 Tax=Ailuropoda melanoleuca TaxID=9646 RepID=UPI001494F2D9|nr:FXYD domain-containing ion transport regulator 7 isoform X2 [Ailuropoda melanoleuca]